MRFSIVGVIQNNKATNSSPCDPDTSANRSPRDLDSISDNENLEEKIKDYKNQID
jgi:hypothetical protein